MVVLAAGMAAVGDHRGDHPRQEAGRPRGQLPRAVVHPAADPAARRAAPRPAPADDLELVAPAAGDPRRSSGTGCSTHWNKERITLVALGIICFYVVYVTYRNIKSFLPFVIETKYDRELHLLDHALLFGHDPATVLHTVLGTGDHGLRAVLRLPVVPADGAAGGHRVGGLVAQPVLRLLVRDLAVPGLGARHHLLLRAAHARARLPLRPALHRPAEHAVRAADGLPRLHARLRRDRRR